MLELTAREERTEADSNETVEGAFDTKEREVSDTIDEKRAGNTPVRELPLSDKLRILGEEISYSLGQVADDIREVDQPIVTIFGTSREHGFNAKYAELCYEISRALAAKGILVASGGGSGVMKAANKGPYDQGSDSIAIHVEGLTDEAITNEYFTIGDRYANFFSRQLALNLLSNVVIVFPGGIVTDYEFISRLTTLKSAQQMYPYFVDKSEPNPIILVGKKFWQPLVDDMRRRSKLRGAKVNESMDNVIVTDDPQEVIRIAEAAAKHRKVRETQEQIDAVLKPLNEAQFSQREIPAPYQGANLKFVEVTARMTDGSEKVRVLASPADAVDVICPVIDNGATSFLVENDYRPIAGGYLSQNIAGKIASGETTVEAAQRILSQEGGVATYHDFNWGLEIYPASDLTTERVHAMKVNLAESDDAMGNQSSLSSDLVYVGSKLSTNEKGNSVTGLTKTSAIRAWTREGNTIQGRLAFYALREGRLKGVSATEKGLSAGIMLSQLPPFKTLSSELIPISESDPDARVEITTIDRREHFAAWKATREKLDSELRDLLGAEENRYTVPDYELSETDSPTRTLEVLTRANSQYARIAFMRPDGSVFYSPELNFAARKPEIQIPAEVIRDGETAVSVTLRKAEQLGFKVSDEPHRLFEIINSAACAGRKEEIIVVHVEDPGDVSSQGVWIKPELAVVMNDAGSFHDLGTLVTNEAVYDYLERTRPAAPIQLGIDMDRMRKNRSRRNLLGLRQAYNRQRRDSLN